MVDEEDEGMEDLEDEGFRHYGSSGDMDHSHRPAVIVLVFLLLFVFLGVVVIWNGMHSHAPASDAPVYWNGIYDAQTNTYLYKLRNWVDPDFIFNPHRTTFFDVASEDLMTQADGVCLKFGQGVSYSKIELSVSDALNLPPSPANFFIATTVATYCPKFGPLTHSTNVTATLGGN
jgi:hypothetical protein